MAEADDLFVGRVVLEREIVSRDELVPCLHALSLARHTHRAVPPLGILLVKRKLLSMKNLMRILSERNPARSELTASQQDDLDLGSLFVLTRIATEEQVRECLIVQRATKVPGRPSLRLAELLVQKGYTTAAQARRVLAYHSENMFICVGCSRHFSIQGAKAGRAYTCPHCETPLMQQQMAVQRPGSGLYQPANKDVFESRRREETKQRLPRRPEEQSDRDRAVALFVISKKMARPEQVSFAQAFQAELEEYGISEPLDALLERTRAINWSQYEEIGKQKFEEKLRKPGWLKQAIPGYLVERRIAQGGTSTIFLARSAFDERQVVLKIMHGDRSRDPESVKRFEREAWLLNKLDHPSVLKILDHGSHKAVHYMVVEYVDGRSLVGLAGGGRGIGLRLALLLMSQATEALRHLHLERYIHRDIKPDNFMVSKESRIKLCDYEYAVPIGSVEGGETTVGTANYMSPEQARGESDLGPTSDVYSMGLVLFFLLSGRDRYSGKDAEEVFKNRFETPDDTKDLEALKVPGPVRSLLAGMLQPNPAARVSSASDLLNRLEEMRQTMGA